MKIEETLIKRPLNSHSLLQMINDGDCDLDALNFLVSNAYAYTASIPKYYALLIGRSNCPATQSILASQLNDELGNGNPENVHTDKMRVFIDALSSVVDQSSDRSVDLSFGRNWAEAVEDSFVSFSPAYGVGAIIASEIRGEEFNIWLGETMGRQNKIDLRKFDWFNEHAELEADHAADGARLYALQSSEDDQRDADLGAAFFDDSLWQFMDNIFGSLEQKRAA